MREMQASSQVVPRRGAKGSIFKSQMDWCNCSSAAGVKAGAEE